MSDEKGVLPAKSVESTSNSVSLKAKKVEEKKEEKQEAKLFAAETRGEGDCAFHSVLGEWNPENSQYECEDVDDLRQKVKKAVSDSKPDSEIHRLAKSGIVALIMEKRSIGPETAKLLKRYSSFVHEQSAVTDVQWRGLESLLRQYPSIVEYIQTNVHSSLKRASLKGQLFDVLNNKDNKENSEMLRALILSVKPLSDAFIRYNFLSVIDFDWDGIPKKAVEEYAKYLGRSGTWFLPLELNIIACVFDTPVDYYSATGTSKITYCPQGKKPKVAVKFVGNSHYERLTDNPSHAKAKQSATSTTTDADDLPDLEDEKGFEDVSKPEEAIFEWDSLLLAEVKSLLESGNSVEEIVTQLKSSGICAEHIYEKIRTKELPASKKLSETERTTEKLIVGLQNITHKIKSGHLDYTAQAVDEITKQLVDLEELVEKSDDKRVKQCHEEARNSLQAYTKDFIQHLITLSIVKEHKTSTAKIENLSELAAAIYNIQPGEKYSESELNKRFRKLSLRYHPDKNPEDRVLYQQMMHVMVAVRDQLVENLHNAIPDVGKSLEVAHEWYGRLKEAKNTPAYGAIFEKTYYAYVDARKKADKLRLVEYQIEVRQFIAVLFLMDDTSLLKKSLYLEAQLYVLAAIRLTNEHLKEPKKSQALTELEKIFNKIRTKQNTSAPKPEESKASTKKPSKKPPSKRKPEVKKSKHSSSSLVTEQPVSSQALTIPSSFPTTVTQFKEFNNQTKKSLFSLALLPSRDLVEYKISTSSLQSYESNSKITQVKGASMQIGGVGIGGVVAVTQAIEAYGIFSTMGTLALGPIAWGVAGVGAAALGLYYGVNAWCEGSRLQSLTQEATELSGRIQQGMKHYDQGKYHDFLECLAFTVGKDFRLLRLDLVSETVVSVEWSAVKELTTYGFRPDGIVYLLNLVGEVLLSGQIKPLGKLDGSSDVENAAARIFEMIIKDEDGHLKGSAEEIDKAFKPGKRYISVQTVRSKFSYYYYGKETHSDIQLLSISNRLKVVTNMARLNLAVILLLSQIPEKIERAQRLINEAIKSMADIAQHDHANLVNRRLEVLSDLSGILGYTSYDTDRDEIKAIASHKDVRLKKLQAATTLKDSKETFSCKIFPPVEGEDSVFHAASKAMALQGYDNLDISRTDLEKRITEALKGKEREPIIALLRKLDKRLFTDITVEIGEHMTTYFYDNWQRVLSEKAQLEPQRYLPFIARLWRINIHLFVQKGAPVSPLAVEQRRISYASTSPTVNLLMAGIPDEASDMQYYFMSMQVDKDTTLLEISNSIDNATTQSSRIIGYQRRGDYYRDKAKEAYQKQHVLQAKQYWVHAIHDYDEALKIDESALLRFYKDYIEGLIALNYYENALGKLDSIASKVPAKDYADCYYLRGLILLKKRLLPQAERAFNRAEELYKTHDQFSGENQRKVEARKKQLVHMHKNMSLPLSRRVKEYKGYELSHEAKQEEKEDYSVLSIDGGGIRGVIPAVILSEIEKRTKRPLAQSFQLIAGTSTGSIIAAGLSAPAEKSETLPRYSAGEVLDFYLLYGQTIFSTSYFRNVFSYFTPLYDVQPLEKLLERYFQGVRLSQTVTRFLAPTIDTSAMEATFTFDSQKAKLKHQKDFLIRQVCRASSAAPTFFKPFQLDKQEFIDGGVTNNNPSKLAYSAVPEHSRNSANTFFLSLGTGRYAFNPLEPSSYSGKLFWAKNFSHVALATQEEDAHHHLSSAFFKHPNNYVRMQPDLPKLIKLDDVSDNQLETLVDVAETYIEEDDAQDNGQLRQIVKRFEM